jgi:hypothetical protein
MSLKNRVPEIDLRSQLEIFGRVRLEADKRDIALAPVIKELRTVVFGILAINPIKDECHESVRSLEIGADKRAQIDVESGPGYIFLGGINRGTDTLYTTESGVGKHDFVDNISITDLPSFTVQTVRTVINIYNGLQQQAVKPATHTELSNAMNLIANSYFAYSMQLDSTKADPEPSKLLGM